MNTVADTPKRRTFKGMAPEDRQRERRERFLEAGFEAFGLRGYHGVTVREICAEAKLTERYFYESFKDREALFSAIYERQVGVLRERIGAMLAQHGPDPRAMTRATLNEFFTVLRDDPRMTRVLFVDVLTISPAVEKQARGAIHGWGQMFEQLAQLMFPRIRDSGLDPTIIALGLVGACINIAMSWVSGGFQEPVERIRDNCYAIFDGLIAAWANPAAVKLPPPK